MKCPYRIDEVHICQDGKNLYLQGICRVLR